jgi:hypothetical protein
VTAALERLLALEVDATKARRLAGRLRFACPPTPASLEDFDYDAAGLDRQLITELGTCRYLESATNLLLIGRPRLARSAARWLQRIDAASWSMWSGTGTGWCSAARAALITLAGLVRRTVVVV